MKFFDRILTAVAGAVVGAAVATQVIGPALALVVPPQYAPRQFPTQQKHYVRLTIPFNACNYVSLTCNYRAAAIPYNAFITNGWVQVLATFTGATTMTASVGTSAGGTQIINAANILTAGAGTAATIVAANLGEAATGNGIAPTGADGGFDFFVTLTATVAVPTAGLAVIIVEYVAPNDGLCTYVPLGASATGC